MKQFSKTLICTKENAWLIVGNAVFWAAAILVASRLDLQVGGNSMTVTGMLIAGWFAVHTIIQGKTKAGSC